jgi:ankyrin repeat protein
MKTSAKINYYTSILLSGCSLSKMVETDNKNSTPAVGLMMVAAVDQGERVQANLPPHDVVVRPVADRYIDFFFAREVYETDRDGRTPLMEAAERGDETSVFLLLTHMSINLGMDAEETRQLVDQKCNDWRQMSALHLAASNGFDGIVNLLLQQDANIEIQTRLGHTPLACAVAGSHVSVVKLLLECGAEHLDWRDPSSDDTFLHFASTTSGGSHDISIATLLLERGLDVNARNRHWQTALHVAVANQQGRRIATMVHLLLAKGADIHATDSKGRTPLHVASMGSDQSIVHLLLSKGANVHTLDGKGRTALHLAAGWNDNANKIVAVLRVLLRSGADIRAKDYDGWTALHWATRGNSLSIPVLLEHGVDVNAQDGHFDTALDILKRDKCSPQIMALLDKHLSS